MGFYNILSNNGCNNSNSQVSFLDYEFFYSYPIFEHVSYTIIDVNGEFTYPQNCIPYDYKEYTVNEYYAILDLFLVFSKNINIWTYHDLFPNNSISIGVFVDKKEGTEALIQLGE